MPECCSLTYHWIVLILVGDFESFWGTSWIYGDFLSIYDQANSVSETAHHSLSFSCTSHDWLMQLLKWNLKEFILWFIVVLNSMYFICILLFLFLLSRYAFPVVNSDPSWIYFAFIAFAVVEIFHPKYFIVCIDIFYTWTYLWLWALWLLIDRLWWLDRFLFDRCLFCHSFHWFLLCIFLAFEFIKPSWCISVLVIVYSPITIPVFIVCNFSSCSVLMGTTLSLTKWDWGAFCCYLSPESENCC